MMLPIRPGVDVESNQPLFLNADSFRTHCHLIAATGAGKTTAIHAILRPLMAEPREKACIFVLDRMENPGNGLLQWMATKPRLKHVRERLHYISLRMVFELWQGLSITRRPSLPDSPRIHISDFGFPPFVR